MRFMIAVDTRPACPFWPSDLHTGLTLWEAVKACFIASLSGHVWKIWRTK